MVQILTPRFKNITHTPVVRLSKYSVMLRMLLWDTIFQVIGPKNLHSQGRRRVRFKHINLILHK